MKITDLEKLMIATACTVFLSLTAWGGLSLNSLQQSYAGMAVSVDNIEVNVDLLREQQIKDVDKMRDRIRTVEKELYARKGGG